MSMLTTYWLSRTPGQDPEGPFTPAQLRRMSAAGSVTVESQVCRRGESEWISLEDELALHEAEQLAAAGPAVGQAAPPMPDPPPRRRSRLGVLLILAGVLLVITAVFSHWAVRKHGSPSLDATGKAQEIAEAKLPTSQRVRNMLNKLQQSDLGKKAALMMSTEVKVSYDKFKGITSYSLIKPFRVNDDVEMTGHLASKMQDFDASIFLLFRREHDDWAWLHYHDTRVKMDADIWQEPMGLMSSMLGAGRVSETQPIAFSLERAAQTPNATELGVQIGSDEFEIRPEMRLAILCPLMRWLVDMAEKHPAP
jgi:hypothetical protein